MFPAEALPSWSVLLAPRALFGALQIIWAAMLAVTAMHKFTMSWTICSGRC